MDPDWTAHMSSLVCVFTMCLQATEAFRWMTGEKTLVVIGALGVKWHFIWVCKYPDKQCGARSQRTYCVDPDWSAHTSSLVQVLTFCQKATEAFRRMTGKKAFVIWCVSFGPTLLASRDRNIYTHTNF